MKKILLSFLLIISLFFNISTSVYATSGGGYSRSDLSGFDNWTLTEKMNFWGYQFEQIVLHVCGLATSDSSALQIALESMWDELLLEDCTYEEWITTRLGVRQNETSGEYELVIDNELSDLIYNASVQYIEEETGFYVIRTGNIISAANYLVSGFRSSTQYNTFKSYCNSLDNNKLVFFNGASISTDSYKKPDETWGYKMNFFVLDLSDCDMTATKTNPSYTWFIGTFYDSNWQIFNKEYMRVYIDEDGNIEEVAYSSNELPGSFNFPGIVNSYCFYYPYELTPITPSVDITAQKIGWGIYSNSGYSFRAYKSLDDLKQYSVGTRPYYITDKFANYDASVDNSTTITQTEIDNSITYGDVYNYIINNYDNPDGLTEEELRAILEEYLSKIGGGSGSGSGGGSGGSDDGGSSGGGLGSFLEGLGSIGDAILSILGKLLEYIGKALELLTGTVTKVLDLIPSNVTNLLLGLFPFIPQEWVTAIELSLVLGVVLVVVGAFKK